MLEKLENIIGPWEPHVFDQANPKIINTLSSLDEAVLDGVQEPMPSTNDPLMSSIKISKLSSIAKVTRLPL